MRDELPVLSGLMERGAWGKLESCDPPITVPAWSCMMSSKDPGTLGFYGFRNRKDHSYDGLAFATSEKVRDDRLWDILVAGRQARGRPRRAADVPAAAGERRDGRAAS